jgi:hypothetical protein
LANPVGFPYRPFQLRIAVWVVAQDVAANLSLIGWQLWIDKLSYSPTSSAGLAARWLRLNGIYVHENYGSGFDFVSGSNYLIASGQTWFSHNADGTLPMYAESQADFDILGPTAVASTSLSVPTIPRASTSSIAPPYTRDAGTSITINTNRASTAFTHTLKYSFAGATGTIATGVGASYAWTPPLSLLANIPNATSALLTLTTETYSGATLIGTRTSSFTLAVPSTLVPTIGSLTVVDDNPTVASIVGTFVKGLSILRATVNASGIQGSSIASRTFTMGGTTVASGGQIPVTASGVVPVTASATDSRGRVGAFAGSITALNYAQPLLTTALVRRATSGGVVDETNGTYLRVDLVGAVSSLINSTQRNSLTYKVFTRARGTSTWTARNSVLHGSLSYNSNFLVTGGGIFPINQAYDVMVQVVDKFNTAYVIVEVPTGAIFMHWSLTGVGIGGYHALGKLDVNGDIYSSGRIVPVSSTDSETIAGTAADLAVTPLSLQALTATESRRGLIEVATQAEANANDDTRALTAAKVRNLPHMPWAYSAGLNAIPGSGVTTITLPAGRFSVPPRIVANPIGMANVSVVHFGAITKDDFEIRVFTLAGAQVAASVLWHAVQMTSASADG